MNANIPDVLNAVGTKPSLADMWKNFYGVEDSTASTAFPSLPYKDTAIRGDYDFKGDMSMFPRA